MRSISVDPDMPISLYAPLHDQAEPSTSGGSSTPAHSTGRMKPISNTGSPRVQDVDTSMVIRKHKNIKGIAFTSVSSDPSSPHTYPKISVRPGKKDATVLSYFHHPFPHPESSKPYKYMEHQSIDSASDSSKPAKKFQIGLRKIDWKSEDAQHARAYARYMSSNQHHPKAALVHVVRGDNRAERKRPTIDVDQGKLHGNLLITSYGPESPPKHTNPSRQPHMSNPADTANRSQYPSDRRTRSRSPCSSDEREHARQRTH